VKIPSDAAEYAIFRSLTTSATLTFRFGRTLVVSLQGAQQLADDRGTHRECPGTTVGNIYGDAQESESLRAGHFENGSLGFLCTSVSDTRCQELTLKRRDEDILLSTPRNGIKRENSDLSILLTTPDSPGRFVAASNKIFPEIYSFPPGISSGFSRRLQCTYGTTNIVPYSASPRLRVSNRPSCASPPAPTLNLELGTLHSPSPMAHKPLTKNSLTAQVERLTFFQISRTSYPAATYKNRPNNYSSEVSFFANPPSHPLSLPRRLRLHTTWSKIIATFDEAVGTSVVWIHWH
jgi:hypothetical protein